MKDIHLSLDDAREELLLRWQDHSLKMAIEEELDSRFMADFKYEPRGVVFKQICPPDNGFTFFYQCSKYIGAKPLILEYHEDIFTHINEEKKGLGRLRVTLENGTTATVDIMNFHQNEKKKLAECILKTGDRLLDFHHNLFTVAQFQVDFLENSSWFKNIGRASEYYYYLLLHFVAHGFLFETLSEGDEKEVGFANDIMIPAMVKIKDRYGSMPMLVKSYPDNQDDAEDFYWWSYPHVINDHIIGYAKKHDLPFKNYKI